MSTDRCTWIYPYGRLEVGRGVALISGITEEDIHEMEECPRWIGPVPSSSAADITLRGTVSPWGIASGGIPYYETTGATFGEQARVFESATIPGTFWLETLP